MSALLTAYLERLVHPARKAYAVAYAAHLSSGTPAPKAKGLNREAAAKIARKVARYAADVSTPTAADLGATIRAYALERGDTELLGLVEAFVPATPADDEQERLEREVEAELEYGAYLESEERMSDYYTPECEPRFVETAEVDVLDLTGLEPILARELALKLARWNGGGAVYNRRGGRRYLHGKVRRIDLNDVTVQGLPNYDDLVAVVKERGVRA